MSRLILNPLAISAVFCSPIRAGRAGIYARLGRILPDLNRDSPEIQAVVKKLKEMEADGYTYENADGSFELLALDTLGRRPSFFRVWIIMSQPARRVRAAWTRRPI